ncbi:hypothetical protein E1A91_D10G050600v1 [Gossypium mustelinum]|uniref:Uncharacterized protein n=1 Tax=Gossypium mustelinum TaxID=34275 RepID=A0A5D2T589_GOSMU|nr:hypothetical protein E1A91_D10G050600v1 [Gossypium mustelinum]
MSAVREDHRSWQQRCGTTKGLRMRPSRVHRKSFSPCSNVRLLISQPI